MSIPTQAGRYVAKPVNYAVEPSDKADSQSVAWVCQYDLLQYYNRASNEWLDVSQDGLQITGWHYVIKKDGQPNDTQIKQLKAAIGWDGKSLSSLEMDTWRNVEVQLTVDNEKSNDGKFRMKANWIDPINADPVGSGGVKRAEPSVIQSLDAKYGPMLRAIGGANGTPARPQTSAPQRPPLQDNDALTKAARTKAWEAFKLANTGMSNDELTEPWRALLKTFSPGRSSTTFTAGDWKKVQEAIESPAQSPLSESPEFTEDQIPF